MFENFDFGTVLQLFGQYLTIRVGEVDLGAVATSILVLSLAVAFLSGFNLWRIGQSEDRQARLARRFRAAPEPAQAAPRGPRWYQRLAAGVAMTPFVGTAEQEKLLGALAAAGIKGQGSLANIIASKACGAVALTALAWLFLEWRQWFAGLPAGRWAMLIGALMLGWRLPDLILRRLAAHRRLRIEQGMPDALDLLVVSAEAGLSLDQAIEEVSRGLRPSNPVVAEEFAITAAEMRVLSDRAEALQNLVRRTKLASLRSITASLGQAIRFGTPLAESMRVLAAQMRAERLARIEERAARLPVLLAIPMMVFVMPALLIVIATAPALRIIDFLSNFKLGAAP
jgi:tight adherence protein C